MGGFNTQPPEGGWSLITPKSSFSIPFQHTAARRRLDTGYSLLRSGTAVSTHSRPKAAGRPCSLGASIRQVSTHSRPKAAGSRPALLHRSYLRFNTQPPEGGWSINSNRHAANLLFQHTAARRRLGPSLRRLLLLARFNTQPPEGGWPYRPF